MRGVYKLTSGTVVAFLVAACVMLVGCGPSEEHKEPEPATESQMTLSDRMSTKSDRSDLQAQITSEVANYAMQTSVAFIDLSDGSSFDVGGSNSQVSASMIKLLVLAKYLEQREVGAIDGSASYVLTSADIVGGTGTMQSLGAGAETTYDELAFAMISCSDNVAANVLIDKLGMPAINAYGISLGLEGTSLERRMMDSVAVAQGVENHMSAKDAADLLAMIYQGELVSKQASAFALEALLAQEDRTGLIQGIPSTVSFAHKTGLLSDVKNDGGIVFASEPYVLVVMCEQGPNDASFSEAEAAALMQEVSQTVYAAI